MPRLSLDSHGLYLRHAGSVWRPEPNHTYRRQIKTAHSFVAPHMFKGVSGLSQGLLVRVFGERYLTIMVEPLPNLMNVSAESWSVHGLWTGKSEDAWFAHKGDLDDAAFQLQQDQQLKESRALLKGLKNLISGL